MKKLLLLVLPVLMFSCSSDGGSGSSNNSGVAYIKGDLDGTAFNYTVTETSTDYFYNYLSGYSALDFDRWYYYGGSFYTPTFTPTISIAWDNMVHTDSEATETTMFYDAFNTIPTNYLTEDESNNLYLKGVDIQYENEAGVFYNTMYGSQAGSTFTVTSSSEGIEEGGTLQTKTISGTYSCKLYNSNDRTDFLTVTNGSYKVIIREYN